MSAREVSLVLCTAAGDLLGATAPFTVANPWWSTVEDVVATARTALGVDARVLRILHMQSDADSPGGGPVAYSPRSTPHQRVSSCMHGQVIRTS
jgi:hypothetical protein